MHPHPLSRRRLLQTGTLGFFTATVLPSWLSSAALAQTSDKRVRKILFYNKSEGFEHSVVKSVQGAPTYAERQLKEFAGGAGFEFVSTKDGTVFDGDLDQYDAFFFFTQGDLSKPGLDKQPPVTESGKKKLLAAVAAGKGLSVAIVQATRFILPNTRQARRSPIKATLILTLPWSVANSFVTAVSKLRRCAWSTVSFLGPRKRAERSN